MIIVAKSKKAINAKHIKLIFNNKNKNKDKIHILYNNLEKMKAQF